jgi:hypothetical protein
MKNRENDRCKYFFQNKSAKEREREEGISRKQKYVSTIAFPFQRNNFVPLVKTKICYKYFLSVIKRIINHYKYENINNKTQYENREKGTRIKRVELQSCTPRHV